MQPMTRSAFLEGKMEEFLASSKTTISIPLYGNEIKKITKRYENVAIEKGEKCGSFSANDKRIICTITKTR